MIDRSLFLTRLDAFSFKNLGVNAWRGLAETLFAVALAAGVAAVAILLRDVHYVGGFLFGWLGMAIAQHRLSIIHHEAIHGLLFPKKALNDGIGLVLVGAALGALPAESRKSHLGHHKYLGTPRDPEGEIYADSPACWRDLARAVLRTLSGADVARRAFALLKRTAVSPKPDHTPMDASRRPTWGDWAAVAAAQALLIGGFAAFGRSLDYLLLWALPLATSTRCLMMMRTLAEHARKQETADPEELFLNTIHCGPIERFVFGPIGFNHHAEHHLFPNVPSWRWLTHHKTLSALPPFKERVRVWTGYMSALRGMAGNRRPKLLCEF